MTEPWNNARATVPGEWWWLVAVFEAITTRQIPLHSKVSAYTSTGGIRVDVFADDTYTTQLGIIQFIGHIGENNQIQTDIHIISADPAYNDQWKQALDMLTQAAGRAKQFHYTAIGWSFQTILDRYYDLKKRGERPKLRQMAEEAGVNYGSLRQAKIAYDQKMKTNKQSED